MRIGILFGGRSREREISFAGGRTVYDLLDKSLFTPVPIFIDSLGNMILLDWQYLYKGSIKDFYPPVSMIKGQQDYQVYIESLNPAPAQQEEAINAVGKRVSPEELKSLIDFAFLALHGPYGEDGSIQGLLEFYDIPYSGSGILPSAIGINKSVQKQLMEDMGILAAKSITISRTAWLQGNRETIFDKIRQKFELPVVIKSSTQGSSIGVSILREWSFSEFEKNVSESFFIKKISRADWQGKDTDAKRIFIQQISDIYEGAGIPFKTGGRIIHHQAELSRYFDEHFSASPEDIYLESLQTEPAVLVEEFIDGKEFSCIVIEGATGEPIALPPTEIIKKSSIFDYRAKYLPGISRKVTPIDLPEETINTIASSCEKLYQALHFDVYARIDGLIKKDGSIYLNDPNTTSGMLPSSFFFHQAAEIGLSPGQFLTYIVHKSLEKRRDSSHQAYEMSRLLDKLDKSLQDIHNASVEKLNIGVVLGGYSSERHISVESGRNVFEKISSSGKYNAFPVLLTRKGSELKFYVLPLNLLLKDNADDIAEKASHYAISPVIEKIIEKAKAVTSKFASSNYQFYPKKISLDELTAMADFVFIGLHGRPGEDGELQKLLQQKGVPYNGSGTRSSAITIDKYLTNEILKANGFMVPEHKLIEKAKWLADNDAVLNDIESSISYPLIAKPSDDGCSSAVKKIKSRQELKDFIEAIFRNADTIPAELAQKLDLKPNEEFPVKEYFVVEEMVTAGSAEHFLEITGGMLTYFDANGEIRYEVFEPSEALAQKGILSLEEKFLAGEGQNITPARFAPTTYGSKSVSAQVRETLERAARVLNIEGYSRIDAFVRTYKDGKVEVIFIEVNSLPGLTPATCIFHQAALNGYKPFEFLDHIIQYGFQKIKQGEYHTAS